MTRRLIEPSFDPDKPVIVRKKFTANGRHLKPGDKWDWKKQAIPLDKVVRHFNAGLIRNEQPNEKPLDAAPTPSNSTISPSGLEDGDGDSAFEETSEEDDGLDAIDNMQELRDIAKAEGADIKVSKVQQRQAIRENRKAKFE